MKFALRLVACSICCLDTIRIFIPLLSFQRVRIGCRRGVSSYFLYLRLSSKPCSQPFPPPAYFKPAARAWPNLQPAISSAAAANRLVIAAVLSCNIPVPPRAPAFHCSSTLCCGSGLHSTQGSNLTNPLAGSPGNSMTCCTPLRVCPAGEYM